MNGMPPPLLEVRELRAGYGELEVLRGISFTLLPGTITAVIGPNGAGKSTLLRVLFGRLPSASGQIMLAGEPLAALTPARARRRGLSYVAQGRCNFPLMSVRENLEMAGYLRRDRDLARDIDRLMDRFPLLRARAAARAGDLSGGQQQLLELAMGLLSHPLLLLVDEPSMGLAPATMGMVFETIREINASGTTVLLVEQNARRALEIAHRGLVMDLGTIRYDAPAEQLLRDPRVSALYLGGDVPAEG